ncbi:unnamed protein product [Dibothriocephalus latus]|uniref:Uncharacterized protein n=1 Tax=Dibothriocephalus latus TaxID=60516 RepID=A0A3P7LRZ1_DIBLA|nr:unnamed protein product [Dibothriocephalus latus]
MVTLMDVTSKLGENFLRQKSEDPCGAIPLPQLPRLIPAPDFLSGLRPSCASFILPPPPPLESHLPFENSPVLLSQSVDPLLPSTTVMRSSPFTNSSPSSEQKPRTEVPESDRLSVVVDYSDGQLVGCMLLSVHDKSCDQGLVPTCQLELFSIIPRSCSSGSHSGNRPPPLVLRPSCRLLARIAPSFREFSRLIGVSHGDHFGSAQNETMVAINGLRKHEGQRISSADSQLMFQVVYLCGLRKRTGS